MKKIITLSLAVVALSLASCKKDYTCTCTASTGGSNTYTITKASKKTAQANCASYTQTNNGVTYTETCTLSK